MLMQQAKQVYSGLQKCCIYRRDVCHGCISEVDLLLFVQGNVPTREAIHVYYQEQMMKSSRESGLDYSTHEAKLQTSTDMGREEEVGVSPDTDEEEAVQSAEEKPENEPGGDYPDKPELGPETVLGADGPDEPGPVSQQETLVAPSSAEGDTAMEVKGEECPECLVAKTYQRCRPKLWRMARVQSFSCSSSSEEEHISRTHR